MSKELNKREQRFLLEYLVDLNPVRAAMVSGYSKSVAHTKAYQWVILSARNPKPHLREALQAKIQERAEKTGITIDEIEAELVIIGRADIRDYVDIGPNGEVTTKPFSEIPPDASRAIAKIKEVRRIIGSGKNKIVEIRTELVFHNKVEALELLGKRRGMWRESIELMGGPMAVAQIMIVMPDNQREKIDTETDSTQGQIPHDSK